MTVISPASSLPASPPDTSRARPRALALWLFGVTGMIFLMALIGAITRLTESGLSMVEWRPLIGTLPPMTDAEWQRVFDLYRETPEYRLKNAGMGLEAFKEIFFWEWFHRLWGRLIGVAYAVPYAVFLALRAIPRGWHLPLLGLFLLGGLQGVVGMWMVESGLVDRPAVSHYRLATHLGMAMLLYALCLAAGVRGGWPFGRLVVGWLAVGFGRPARERCWRYSDGTLITGSFLSSMPSRRCRHGSSISIRSTTCCFSPRFRCWLRAGRCSACVSSIRGLPWTEQPTREFDEGWAQGFIKTELRVELNYRGMAEG